MTIIMIITYHLLNYSPWSKWDLYFSLPVQLQNDMFTPVSRIFFVILLSLPSKRQWIKCLMYRSIFWFFSFMKKPKMLQFQHFTPWQFVPFYHVTVLFRSFSVRSLNTSPSHIRHNLVYELIDTSKFYHFDQVEQNQCK